MSDDSLLAWAVRVANDSAIGNGSPIKPCLLYTSDAADEN